MAISPDGVVWGNRKSEIKGRKFWGLGLRLKHFNVNGYLLEDCHAK